MRVARAQKIKIGRRIYLPQRAVQIERLNFGRKVESLREDDLKYVPGGNVFLATLHPPQKILSLGAGMHFEFAFRFAGFAPHRRTQSRREFSLKSGNVSNRPIVGAPRAFALHVSRRHDVNLVPQVIKCEQTIEKHQFRVRQAQVIFGVVADSFQLSDDVVGEVSDRSRSERRQSGNGCGMMLAQQSLDDLENIVPHDLALAAALNLNGSLSRSHSHVRTRAKKGVASDLLATLDGFE